MDHDQEQDTLTAEWDRQADLYITAAGGRPDHLSPELDFQVDDAGAWVTIRVWVSREEAGI